MQETIQVYPPLIGVIIDLSKVPDPVFAEKMVGDGVAIEPLENKIYAPVSGVVKSIHAAKHAITITSDAGFDILIHIGLETVNSSGGFDIYTRVGDKVTSQMVLGEIDLDYLATHSKSLITPVLLVDLDEKIFSFSCVEQDLCKLDSPIMQVYKKSALINVKNTGTRELIKSDMLLIQNAHGIHARPAAVLTAIAKTSDGDIFIEKSGDRANLKSITSILSLSLSFGDEVYIWATNLEVIKKIAKAIDEIIDAPVDAIPDSGIIKTLHENTANKYYGISASPGIAIGDIFQQSQLKFNFTRDTNDTILEQERLHSALSQVTSDIQSNITKLSNTQTRDILEAHLLILTDPDLIQKTINLIGQHKSAGFALSQVIKEQCEVLAKSNNPLLIERQADFKGVCSMLLSAMDGVEHVAQKFTTPTILVKEELTPSDLSNLDENIVGLISVLGGVTSHVAIMARARGIPLLTGVDIGVLTLNTIDQVILDTHGENAFLNIAPTSDEVQVANSKHVEIQNIRSLHLKEASSVASTLDGVTINCYANVANPKDAEVSLENGADGIGLFRTELMFYDRDSAPTVEEQTNIYASMAKCMPDKPFVIRLLDAGGEKPIAYLNVPHEDNPVLGVRGIRLCLENRALLIDQLTAILQAAEESVGNIKIMIPMVSTIEEYREVKNILQEIRTKLNIKANPALGIMVEVPSVALMSGVFAREVDFFSIGTNDLSQYVLAMDRAHTKLANKVDHLNPAVLKAIELVMHGSLQHNIPVSVCGLMASEKLAIPILIGLGIRELSMSLNEIAANKAFIRLLNMVDCEGTARECLMMESSVAVRDYLNTKFAQLMK